MKASADADAAQGDASNRLKPIPHPADPLSTKISDEEIKRVGEIVEEVRQLWLRSPQTPLPAESKLPTYEQRRGRYFAWTKSLYVDAWRAHGNRNPHWNEQAESLLQDFAKPKAKRPPSREMVARARELMDQGCKDPLIRYVIARSLDLNAGTTMFQAARLLRPALNRLGADYSPLIAYRIELRYVEAWNRGHPKRVEEATPVAESAIERIVKAVSGPLTDEQRRWRLLRISDDLSGPLGRYAEPLFQALGAASDADRWLVQVLLARAHVNLAWRERGGGYADTVAEKGWQSFGDHLTKARSLLLQAWKERPDLPDAALDLIRVTMGADGVAGEDCRFWFDRAVAADFDLPEAYRALLWSMRPRWGGSYPEMIRFGRECLSTGRFDSTVPWVYHNALCDVLSEVDDARKVCTAINAYDDYLALLKGSRSLAIDDGERKRLDTVQACAAWLSGHDEEARQQLKELGGDIAVDVFTEFHVTPSDARLTLSGGGERPSAGQRWLQSDVDQIRFAAQADRLVGFGTYSGLRAWDMTDGCKEAFELPIKVEGQLMRDVDISPDGSLLAIILMDEEDELETGAVVLWDIAQGKLRRALAAPADKRAYHVRFSPDGKRVAAGMMDGDMAIWDVETGERPAWGFWPAHGAWIQAIEFTADGKRLATAGADWKVKLWDLPKAGDAAAKPLAANAEWGPLAGLPLSLSFSPDGSRLLVGHDYCEVWDVSEGKAIRQLPGSWAAFAPGGQTIATGGGELKNAARVWDAETGKERARLIGGHRFQLTALAYAPNSRRLITGSADPACQSEGVMRCWNIETGEEVVDFSGCGD
ncbi:MAG TPA: hypothetical protein VHC19_19470 [Pirellulales bacterium]|nr:hypothetical protein [Pirellulales bacterium]